MITIDTKNMCSHLQKKLFEENGIWDLLADYRDIHKKNQWIKTKRDYYKGNV